MRDREPSLTAVGVALARSTLERPATPTGDPAGDEALAATLVTDAASQLRRLGGRANDDPTRRFLGFVTARTEFFDAAVLRAIGAGVHQIVILGAGYDGRALRFRSPDVEFFEVDHPATQADKQARLVRLGVDTASIAFVAADFTEPGLEAALAASGHRRDQRSLFVLEGVLRYLPERWFRELLATLARLAAPGSELAVSISTRPPSEDADDARVRLEHEQRLAESGEPVLTVPERDVALRWLSEAGWAAQSVVDIAELQVGTRPGRLLVLAHPETQDRARQA